METKAFLACVRRTIEQYDMQTPGEPALAALSGGADSVALLRALLLLGYPVRAYHLNHCLRGAESDRDETFCRELCARLGVQLMVGREDVAAAAGDSGIEETARRIRYERLEQASSGAKIATAHTADDNLETVLFHLVRGTGPGGLAGIPPVRGRFVRPLIGMTRAEVEGFLTLLGQDFVTDSTNADTRYTRNRIRHEVVPALRQVNPAAAQAVLRLGALLREDNAYLDGKAQEILARAALTTGGWRVSDLRGLARPIRSRALRKMAAQAGVPMRDFTARHENALEALLESASPSARCSLPNGFAARREYDAVFVEKTTETAQNPQETALSVPFDGAAWPDGPQVMLRRVEKIKDIYKSFNTFYADCGTIDFESLCVRTRRPGDRIRLNANGGSRTLKKLMIDRKIPKARRDTLAVVADRDGVIAVQDIGMDIARAPQDGALIEIKIEG